MNARSATQEYMDEAVKKGGHPFDLYKKYQLEPRWQNKVDLIFIKTDSFNYSFRSFEQMVVDQERVLQRIESCAELSRANGILEFDCTCLIVWNVQEHLFDVAWRFSFPTPKDCEDFQILCKLSGIDLPIEIS